jgi:hypothetical protein
VLDGHRGVVSIGHELSGCPGAAAQILEDLDVERTWMDEPRVGPGDEFTDECEDFVQGRWSAEYSRIGGEPHNPDDRE